MFSHILVCLYQWLLHYLSICFSFHTTVTLQPSVRVVQTRLSHFLLSDNSSRCQPEMRGSSPQFSAFPGTKSTGKEKWNTKIKRVFYHKWTKCNFQPRGFFCHFLVADDKRILPALQTQGREQTWVPRQLWIFKQILSRYLNRGFHCAHSLALSRVSIVHFRKQRKPQTPLELQGHPNFCFGLRQKHN